MARPRCVYCGRQLDSGYDFIVYQDGKSTPYYVCDFQELIEWDCTGDGYKSNQVLRLDRVDLRNIRSNGE